MYVYRRKLYEITQFVIDCLSFWPVWSVSMHFRIALDTLMTRQLTTEEASGWIPPLIVILPLSVAVLLRLRLFESPRQINPWRVSRWAAEVTLVNFSITVLTTFFLHEFGGGASRGFVLCMLPVMFLVFTASRYISMAFIAALQPGTYSPRVALLGDSDSAKRLLGRIGTRMEATIRGVILPEGSPSQPESAKLPVLGTTGQLAELVNRERLDRVIVIQNSISDSELARCNRVFWKMGVPVSSTLTLTAEPDQTLVREPFESRVELTLLNGLRVVDVRPKIFAASQDFPKRAFDLVVSVIAFVVLLPLLMLIALLVKLQSKGPVLERAPRVGIGGRHFTCLKFRTTYEDLNQPAPVKVWNTAGLADKEQHHPTPLGQMLRLSKLDELPQLVNTIRGDMSIVGPRPLPAHYLGPDGMSQKFKAWSETRARVHPGLTGLWQVRRSNVFFEHMIELDLKYVEQRSFWLDLKLIFQTPTAIVKGLHSRTALPR